MVGWLHTYQNFTLWGSHIRRAARRVNITNSLLKFLPRIIADLCSLSSSFVNQPPWHETKFKEPKHDRDRVGGNLSYMETSEQNMRFLNFRDLFATASSFYESCFASTYYTVSSSCPHSFATFLLYYFLLKDFPRLSLEHPLGTAQILILLLISLGKEALVQVWKRIQLLKRKLKSKYIGLLSCSTDLLRARNGGWVLHIAYNHCS